MAPHKLLILVFIMRKKIVNIKKIESLAYNAGVLVNELFFCLRKTFMALYFAYLYFFMYVAPNSFTRLMWPSP